MPLGDGEYVRGALDAFVALLHRFASPTGARASVLLMTGGLVVLGFLFLTFIFRSAIVGDLAPIANARQAVPRVRLPSAGPGPRPGPGPGLPSSASSSTSDSFAEGRAAGRAAKPTIEGVFDLLAREGVEARILESAATRKLVRVYAARVPRERARGLLAGAFETMTGQLAKVDEVAPWHFEVRHVALVRWIR